MHASRIVVLTARLQSPAAAHQTVAGEADVAASSSGMNAEAAASKSPGLFLNWPTNRSCRRGWSVAGFVLGRDSSFIWLTFCLDAASDERHRSGARSRQRLVADRAAEQPLSRRPASPWGSTRPAWCWCYPACCLRRGRQAACTAATARAVYGQEFMAIPRKMRFRRVVAGRAPGRSKENKTLMVGRRAAPSRTMRATTRAQSFETRSRLLG